MSHKRELKKVPSNKINHYSSPEDKLDKKVKKAINRSLKYLRKYRLEVLDREKKEKIDDGGVSIMLAYFQGHYGLNLGYQEDCNNLYKCARQFQEDHPRSLLDFKKKDQDLFSDEFLKDIYFQKSNKYPTEVYLNKLDRHLNEGSLVANQLSKLIPLMDLFTQRKIKYLNVGLALFGMAQKKPSKVLNHKDFKKLKKKVVHGLLKIFQEEDDTNPYSLDATRAYALLLIAFLGDLEKVDQKNYQRFLLKLIKNQSLNGEWVHHDIENGNSQISNLLLTIFSLGTLLEYLNLKLDMIGSHSEIRPVRNKQENSKNSKNSKEVVEGFLGFGGGGFLTQKNMDNMWGSPCLGSSLEIVGLLAILIIAGYLFIKMYQYYNL